MTMRAEHAIQDLSAQALSNANLPRNAEKGDWPHSRARLFALLLVEVWELGLALVALWWVRRGRWECAECCPVCAAEYLQSVEKARQHAKHEAGDCCNFLAFLFSRL